MDESARDGGISCPRGTSMAVTCPVNVKRTVDSAQRIPRPGIAYNS